MVKDILSENEYQKIYKIALFVAIACVLQISESLIPHPIPGIRLGLANVITLIALVTLGVGPAFEIAVLRTILSSFLMGTFMSPTFILSFSGSLVSTLCMGLFYWLFCGQRRCRLSIVGLSILGAVAHNFTQLYLAYLILIKHPGIFMFWPWLAIGAVIMGWITGVVAGDVCRRLKDSKVEQSSLSGGKRKQTDFAPNGLNFYLPGNSFLHRLPAVVKISGVLIMSLLVIIFSNFRLYLGLFLSLIVLMAVSRTSLAALFMKTRRYTSLVAVSFLLPLFFTAGRHILYSWTYFKITAEGLTAGTFFASKILFLIVVNSLLIWTTSPQDLADGLARTLWPLKIFGISAKRIATILSLALMAVPVFWEIAKDSIHSVNLKKVKNLPKLLPLLGTIIITLYLETEQRKAIFGKAVLSPGQTVGYKKFDEGISNNF